MELGIVGLPNVGKSTLFNALTRNAVPAENYPFCTVDPNVGVVPVPDERLDRLAEWVQTGEVTPAAVEFKDIAGLVREAHRGEGLGNQFLAQIRNVDALCHVLRVFEDGEVAHVEGTVDPLRDIEIVETEFALADLEVLEKPLEKLRKKTRVGEDEGVARRDFLEELHDQLSRGDVPDPDRMDDRERRWVEELSLVSCKPVLYVLNVDEPTLRDPDSNPSFRRTVQHIEEETPHRWIAINARYEFELSDLDDEDRRAFLEDVGLEEPGLDRMVNAAYDLLGLITYFTYNESELRAWSLPRGKTALDAAGQIHSDFREGFIRADVVPFEQFREYRSWSDARNAGAVRSRGEDYVVRDGDILLFQFQD